ncbi:induced myeloid leukemia cell differentiation protein Mcl-1 [Bufo gargarizans]|uniref:induced myeloid leukemia cell differentiation protein Mcl-1 n=1 Tax=Bufo gargarizans TaxID=30331 RepID=UPI001CF53EEF|nr:induced myeloid leukemia cell differentiation protein Mcl-1 [Bufo gargarizans]
MMNPAMIRKPASIIPYLYSPGGGALLTTKDGQAVAYTGPLEVQKDGWERQLQGYNMGGSLPSPQSELDEDEDYMDVQSDSRGSTSPPLTPTGSPDPLHTDTRALLHTFFREWAGDAKQEDGDSPRALPTMRRLGGDINEKHRMAFQGMLQKLSIQRPEDIQKLSEVPSMVFSDGVTNWGRIVTVISFGAFVAKHLKSIHMENCVGILADSFTDYLMTQKKEWIVEHNGWDGCVEFFHVEDYESGLKTVLMAFAGVAGLGASLAYMIR